MDNQDERVVRTLLTRIVPRPMIFFNVEVTEHCNLNCVGCGSFSPLADEEYIDVDELERDLARLSSLCEGEMHHINILGGEPLLHPEIIKIMELVRQYFPIGSIRLVTNGILLPKMSREFWECCRNKDITLAPSKYPIRVDYDEIERTAKEFGVKYFYFGNVPEHGGGWIHVVLTESGDRNEVHSFLHCGNANACSILEHGRIYPCPRVAKIKHFNRAFQTDFKVSKRDSIDIYKAGSLEEIMKFLAHPIPFCRYCNRFAHTQRDWGISQKKIEEWT